MLRRVIEWSVENRLLVILLAVIAVGGGVLAARNTPLEALPDLSDVQVIVQTDYPGQAPQIVEDQVTYPVASEMLKVPGAKTVRGYSFFGLSFVYIIFDDRTDLYWARSRVLEYVSAIRGKLPEAATTALGPDATGLGWVYQYVLEDTTGRSSLADLRAYQDWQLRYQLTAVPGVSEVASVGGFQRTYEVTVDPVRLRGYGIPVTRVMDALRASNEDAGAMVVEMAEREFMVRGLGYLRGMSDLDQVVVGSTTEGTPVRVTDVARVTEAPAVRRGVTDLDGRGDAVGGIVVMRFGENALATIDRVKQKLETIRRGLPPGLVITPVYDRSDLIHRSIRTLREKLLEESLVVALVCVLFLFHVRSALVAILTLPVGILMAFLAMRWIGIGADIMSLGGIAIAIGAMIDAAIVMVENLHKHLERAIRDRLRPDATRDGAESLDGEEPSAAGERLHTGVLTTAERWEAVVRSAREVGPSLFFSLLIITVSFLPVFSLEAQEGRLFHPLAWTKTLAMAAASLLSVTLVPVAMGLFIRGHIHAETSNPVNRALARLYRPVLEWALRWRIPVLGGAVAVLVLTIVPFQRIGSEFMPPLDEGTLLYMPGTLPGISIATAGETLRRQDSILAAFPEVEHVFGKAGRAETATDPAPLSMFETTITLKPREEWRKGMTPERLVSEMDRAVQLPGISNSWTMPIKGRIDMLATGIRTPVGIKIFGPDLAELERIGKQVEAAVSGVAGARSVIAERAVSGTYLDIDIDREAAARYGLNVRDIQRVIEAAVGGMTITRTVEGRERYAVRLRYPQELRDRPERIAELLVAVPGRSARPGPLYQASLEGGGPGALPSATIGALGTGLSGAPPGGMGGSPMVVSPGGPAMGAMGASGGVAQIPLGQVATIRTTKGPMAIKTEGAFPTAWVFVDVAGRDIGSFVVDARKMVEAMVTLPPGYSLQWSGQYEYMQRAKERLRLVVPATLLLIFLLLYLNFRSLEDTLIVMLSLPLALVGGVLLMAVLGYNWSVATGVGFIALAGVATEVGVIMLLFLNQAWEARPAGRRATASDLRDAVIEGASKRVRPLIMTVTAVIGGLLPIFWGHGTGATVMRRIAAPMMGGMISATALALLVLPVIWSLAREVRLREAGVRSASSDAASLGRAVEAPSGPSTPREPR